MLENVLNHLKNSLSHCPTIMGKERKYGNAAVLIPLIEVDGQVHVLFQVRAEHIRQGGEIGFPGGMIESIDGGDYEKAAVRETIEELGVVEDQIEVVGYLGTYVAHSFVTIDCYVGILKVDNLKDLPLSEEVAEIFTVPLKTLQTMDPDIHYISMKVQQSFIDEVGDEVRLLDAKSLGLPEKYDKPYTMRKRRVYFYRYDDKNIWGMTGEMLFEFLDLL